MDDRNTQYGMDVAYRERHGASEPPRRGPQARHAAEWNPVA